MPFCANIYLFMSSSFCWHFSLLFTSLLSFLCASDFLCSNHVYPLFALLLSVVFVLFLNFCWCRCLPLSLPLPSFSLIIVVLNNLLIGILSLYHYCPLLVPPSYFLNLIRLCTITVLSLCHFCPLSVAPLSFLSLYVLCLYHTVFTLYYCCLLYHLSLCHCYPLQTTILSWYHSCHLYRYCSFSIVSYCFICANYLSSILLLSFLHNILVIVPYNVYSLFTYAPLSSTC